MPFIWTTPWSQIGASPLLSIILNQNGRSAHRPTPQPSQYEAFLQQFIYDNPDVPPLNDYRDGVKLTVLAREFPARSGPIDAIAIDQQGELYLIETKLYCNPNKRHWRPRSSIPAPHYGAASGIRHPLL
jgi:hypothetical protein